MLEGVSQDAQDAFLKFEQTNLENIPQDDVIQDKIQMMETYYKVMDGAKIGKMREDLVIFRDQLVDKNAFLDTIDEQLMIKQIKEQSRDEGETDEPDSLQIMNTFNLS